MLEMRLDTHHVKAYFRKIEMTYSVIRRANAAKSKIRARVEHVFAEQKDRMELFVRTIGIARAKTKIGMANLVYNFKRLLFWRRTAAA